MDKRITVETMATRSKRDIETKIQWLGPGQRKQQLNQAKKKLTIIERCGREKSDVLNSKILVKQGSMIMTVQNSLLETMIPRKPSPSPCHSLAFILVSKPCLAPLFSVSCI